MSGRRRGAALLCVCLFAAAFPSHADDPAGAGLDLLLLVDRSASMAAYGRSLDEAVPLALHVVAWSGRAAGVRHRFGAISFGSGVRVDVPLTLVGEDTLSLLRSRIGNAGPHRSLGHTNFENAFSAAAAAFRALPDDARRRRAILILTDGHTDVPYAAKGTAVDTVELIPSSVMVDVLLFGQDGDYWRRLSGARVHRVTSSRGELLPVLHRVVAGAVGTRAIQRTFSGATGTLVLPPYLDVVVFDVFRDGSTEPVSIIPPGSTRPLGPLTRGFEEVDLGGTMLTAVVRRPSPGPWTFTASSRAASVTVLSQTFFPRGVLVSPAPSRPPRLHDRIAIAYRLLDGSGGALRELPAYPLTVDVALVGPDGRRDVLPMLRAAGALSALYRTGTTAVVGRAGRYRTEVSVTTADSTGRPLVIFEDHWSGFAVEAAPRVARHSTPRLQEQRVALSRTPPALVLAVLVMAAAGVLWRAVRRP